MLIFNFTAIGILIGAGIVGTAITVPFGITSSAITIPVYLSIAMLIDLYLRLQYGREGLFTTRTGGHLWFIPLWILSIFGVGATLARIYYK